MLVPRAATLAVALALWGSATVLAGCSHTQTVRRGRTLRIALTEYRLNPQHARVSAGTLTIVVHNLGRLTHSLSLTHDGQPVGSTKPIAPGSWTELTISVARGTYVMASTILDDQALGEYGTLSVA